MEKKQIKCYLLSILAVIAGIVLDQYTKLLAVQNLKDQNPFIIIKNVFQLQYLENRGAAFGVLQNQRTFFIFSFIIIVAAVLYLYIKLPVTKRFLPLHVCSVLIVSGAFGNLIDRIRLGYVVDFFYFELINFPIFNVADILVVVGTIILAALILFFYKEDELDFILSFKKRNEN